MSSESGDVILNKRNIIIIAIATIVFIVGIGGFLGLLKKAEPLVVISGNIVNNDYNNYISGGNLCRIGNKLYYNYDKSNSQYGLIEISSQKSKRIFKKDISWLLNTDFRNDMLLKYGDSLCGVDHNSYAIKQFDF